MEDTPEKIAKVQKKMEKRKINLKIKKEKDKESKKSEVDMIPFSQCQKFWEKDVLDKLIKKFVPARQQKKWSELSSKGKDLYNLLNSFEKKETFLQDLKNLIDSFIGTCKKLSLESKTDYWHFLKEHPQLFNPEGFPISCLMNEGVEHLIKISKNSLQAAGNRKSDLKNVFFKFLRIFFMQQVNEKDFINCNFKEDVWINENEKKQQIEERKSAFHYKTTYFMNMIKSNN